MTDELEEKDEDTEAGEGEIADPAALLEHDDTDAEFSIGSPVATFDDDHLPEDEDPHGSFDIAAPKADAHLDPYGTGAPEGFEEGEDEFEADELEEELEADAY